MLQTGVSYLQQHSGEHDSVVLFPYQYIFGIASGRNVAGGVLQSFLAAGPYLSQFDIAGYRRAAAPAGLYFPDGDLSIAIDEVPNFTRTPDVWFWLNRHYRSDQELSPGVFGLLKDDSRADADFTAATAPDHCSAKLPDPRTQLCRGSRRSLMAHRGR